MNFTSKAIAMAAVLMAAFVSNVEAAQKCQTWYTYTGANGYTRKVCQTLTLSLPCDYYGWDTGYCNAYSIPPFAGDSEIHAAIQSEDFPSYAQDVEDPEALAGERTGCGKGADTFGFRDGSNQSGTGAYNRAAGALHTCFTGGCNYLNDVTSVSSCQSKCSTSYRVACNQTDCNNHCTAVFQ